ncbi:MAG: phytochelatin synthase family protein [Lentisphaeraceae bacterium]|nr:phytochelatin synthase family protein [Lentisphaeraceae bacterium]
MLRNFLLITLFFSLVACKSSNPRPVQSLSSTTSHYVPKAVHTVSSTLGSQYIGDINPGKYENLKKYWVAQKKNYCGVCSAVIVLNAARKNTHLTQDNIFSEDIKKIILPETVAKMGLTLRELTNILKTKAKDIPTSRYPAHTSGLDLFREQLIQNNENDSFMITNFSRQSIAGMGMNQGHFSIVAGYNVDKKQVLILEVNSAKESFWISDKNLFTAMKAIDPVSQIPRGWIITGK